MLTSISFCNVENFNFFNPELQFKKTKSATKKTKRFAD